ncbi:hypothetical protein SKAU_G00092100 [Synaphobranchus kaupii]|uniref:Uncharacterized protein n=1 Tax=Synaphobranchus kaupii TaxID=118154 RepID=A0A9Q1J5I1_SYNKA|nr:hypothetical protein SKAU_G00092100 [Synaphobranchus kaupii]
MDKSPATPALSQLLTTLSIPSDMLCNEMMPTSALSDSIPALAHLRWITSLEEREVETPSAQAMVSHARRTWRRARSVLLKHFSGMKAQANRRRHPAPKYTVGQKVALFAGH